MAVVILTLVGCGSDTPPSSGAVIIIPTITDVTPASASVGTQVTISGTNFSTTPSSNIVKFNGTTATVTSSTSIQIITTVPASATLGPITVTVGSQIATSATDFTVTGGNAALFEDNFDSYAFTSNWTPVNGWNKDPVEWAIVPGYSGNAVQYKGEGVGYLVNDYSGADYVISARI